MRIALVGRVAYDKGLFDGQTVKTRNLYELLCSLDNVYLVDTYKYKKHIIRVLFKSILALFKCDIIVLSISINGRRFYFPLFYYLNKIFKKRIYHSLIGGRLANNIEKNPKWKIYINSFEANWVESRELVKKLKEVGIKNAKYLPNFKKLKKVQLIDEYHFCEPYKYCMFCRVQKQKGILEAVDSINKINDFYGSKKAVLDIYGPIDIEFEKEFNIIIEQNSDFVTYKGSVDSNKSVETLKNYYMLLFPTKYYNEGIPGTIIDAFAAGVPVIASEWHYCLEMLDHKTNALIYNFDDETGLFEMIKYSIENVKNIVDMKENCLEKADEYLFDNVLEMIKEEFG